MSWAKVLEDALERGIIANAPRLINRVLSNSSIYAFPFATELAHSKLKAEPNYGTSEYIFGVKRLSFLINYIATIVWSRGPNANPHYGQVIRHDYTRNYSEGTSSHLYDLMNFLLAITALGPLDTINKVDQLAQVPQVFQRVLAAIDDPSIKSTKAQAAFNRRCVAVVRAAIRPLIAKKVGKGAAAIPHP